MKLLEAIGFGEQPTEKRFNGSIGPEKILGEDLSGDAIGAEENYFKIRLAEMFMRDRLHNGREFIPLTVALSSFIYDGRSVDVPCIVGNQMLKTIDQYIKGEYVEFRNTPIIGPVPYAGGDVALFISLYGVQVKNLVKSLFGFLGRMVGVFDIAGLSDYLKIAEQISEGLAGLLGGEDELDPRIAQREIFSDKLTGRQSFSEKYLLYANCPFDALATDRLWVKDQGLMQGKDKTSLKPFRDHDYCLVKIECLGERGDYTTLPFHAVWQELKRLIWQNRQDSLKEADRIFPTLAQQVALSPDLTNRHRNIMIQLYKANYEQEIASFLAAKQPERPEVRGATRGGSREPNARAMVQKTAHLSDRAGISKAARDSLWEIDSSWDKIPHLEEHGESFELTDTVLRQQLLEMATQSTIAEPDPVALSKAIAFAAYPD